MFKVYGIELSDKKEKASVAPTSVSGVTEVSDDDGEKQFAA